MFKRLKKSIIRNSRQREKKHSIKTNTASGDESLKTIEPPLKPVVIPESTLNQEIINLGGEFSLLTLDSPAHQCNKRASLNVTSGLSVYVTAFEETIKESQSQSNATRGSILVDSNIIGDNTLCITAMENITKDEAHDVTPQVHGSSSQVKSSDSLEDCIASFANLSLASRHNTPRVAIEQNTLRLPKRDDINSTTPPLSSPFLVFDLNNDGQAVESGTAYCKKVKASSEKKESSPSENDIGSTDIIFYDAYHDKPADTCVGAEKYTPASSITSNLDSDNYEDASSSFLAVNNNISDQHLGSDEGCNGFQDATDKIEDVEENFADASDILINTTGNSVLSNANIVGSEDDLDADVPAQEKVQMQPSLIISDDDPYIADSSLLPQSVTNSLPLSSSNAYSASCLNQSKLPLTDVADGEFFATKSEISDLSAEDTAIDEDPSMVGLAKHTKFFDCSPLIVTKPVTSCDNLINPNAFLATPPIESVSNKSFSDSTNHQVHSHNDYVLSNDFTESNASGIVEEQTDETEKYKINHNSSLTDAQITSSDIEIPAKNINIQSNEDIASFPTKNNCTSNMFDQEESRLTSRNENAVQLTEKPVKPIVKDLSKNNIVSDMELQSLPPATAVTNQSLEVTTFSEGLKKKKHSEIDMLHEDNKKSVEPLIPKGAYSIDFSKFDDPNFDPFKITKSLSNEDMNEESVVPKGAYSLELDKLDDPNFDPFKSNKGIANSPTKDTGKSDITAVPKESQKVDLGREQADLNVENQSGGIAEQAVSETSSTTETNTSSDTKVIKKPKKKVVKKKQHKPDTSNEGIDESVEPPMPKGAYSIDFSKFDDPNFDPFKTTKSLSNEDMGVESVISKTGDSISFNSIKDVHDCLATELNQKDSSLQHSETAEQNVINADSMFVIKSEAIDQTGRTDNVNVLSQEQEATENVDDRLKPNVNDGSTIIQENHIISSDALHHQSNEQIDVSRLIQKTCALNINATDENDLDSLKISNNLNKDEKSQQPAVAEEQNEFESNKPNDSMLKMFDPLKSELVGQTETADVTENNMTITFNYQEAEFHSNDGTAESGVNQKIERSCSPDTNELNIHSFDLSRSSKETTNFQTKTVNAKGVIDQENLYKNSENMQQTVFSEKCIHFTEKEEIEKNNDIEQIKSEPVAATEAKLIHSTETPNIKELLINNNKTDKPDTSNEVSNVEPPLPKGAYSIDFSKFDDPNFDPFKITKSLSNEDMNEESVIPKGAYSLELDKLDDPNFDPFKSNKGIANSPTKDTGKSDMTAVPEECDKVDLDREETDLNVENQSGGIAEKAVSETSSTTETKTRTDTKVTKKPKKKVIKKKQHKPDTSNEGIDESVEPPMPKGAYSIDFSKFDDPNFDPFKTTKSLSNEDMNEESVISKGAYSLELDKLNDPNFDPFKSNKGIANSPTKDTGKSDMAAVPEESQKVDLDREQADLNVDKQSGGIAEQAASEPTSTTETKTSTDTKVVKKPKKKVIKKKQHKPDTSNEGIDESVEPPMPKGAYSIDFSRFDDPNFDPFKTTKSLSNEDMGEESVVSKGAYSLELDKLDDPNFDPFKSNKGIANSPTKDTGKSDMTAVPEECDKVDLDREKTDLNVENQSGGIAEKAVSETSSTTETKTRTDTKVTKKPKKKVIKKKQHKPDTSNEGIDESVEPPMPKGAYSIDFSKFDDPNFDPFKTTKSLSNEDMNEESVISKGAYSLELDKLNDPNFDPFKSNKGIANSPTKDTGKSDMAAVPEESQKVDLDREQADLNVDKQSGGIAEQAASEPTSTTETKTSTDTKVVKKPKKKVIKKKQHKPDTSNEGIDESVEPPMPKGAYSIDFSRFDDPNFDPFKTTKSLSNEDMGEESVVSKGAYSLELDKLDDPNFDPFKSNKGIANSPTKDTGKSDMTAVPEECDKVDLDREKTDLNVENQSGGIAEKAVSETSSTTETKTRTDTKVTKKPKKKVIKKKQHKPDTSNEGIDESVEPPMPKGAYSIDFSKFDDPNFDPFKTTKSLSNEDMNEESVISKGAYSLELDKLDDPNFDPFKSNKGIANSPTKDTGKSDMAAVPEESQKVDLDREQADLNVDKQSGGIAEQAASEPTSTTETKTSTDTKVVKKPRKKVIKKKQLKPDTSNEGIDESVEPPMPKGAYSIDFSKFDDPNFDPFKTTKSLSNEDMNEESVVPKGAYSLELDKLDDPNFDLFKSNKGMVNSPTKDTGKSDMTAVPEECQKVNLDREQADLNVDKQSGGIGEQAASEPTSTTETDASLSTKVVKKPKKKVVKKKQLKPDTSNEGIDESVEPPMPKGAYNIDFSKFDDPNFDPFKTTKSLSNEDMGEESVVSKGAYSLELDKLDDPNFDPFKSNKGIANSPTKDTGKSDMTAVPEECDKVVLDREQADLNVENQSCGIAEQAVSETSSTTETKTSTDTKAITKRKKRITKKKQLKPDTSNEGIDESVEPTMPKGAYSIDFSKFDDPNFDPFKTTKSSSNEDMSVESVVPKGAYSLELDKLDDPNFDPFKSNRGMANSPTKDVSRNIISSEESRKTTEYEEQADVDNSNDAHAVDNILKTKVVKTPKVVLELESNEDFKPAEEVFQNEEDLAAWEKLWRADNNQNNPPESELRKQSLYVQFDPLVEPVEALEKVMKNNSGKSIAENEDHARSQFIDEDSESTVTGDSQEESRSSTTPSPHHHLHPPPQFGDNMNSKERNEEMEGRSPGINLISFSPGSNCTISDGPVPSGAPTYSSATSKSLLKLSQSHHQEAAELESVALQKERNSLDMEIQDLRQAILDKTLYLEACKITSDDLENVNIALRCEVERAKVEQRRVQDDILSAKRVYHDYHLKASELLPELQAHKQVDQELRQLLLDKQEELKKKKANYQALKKEAESTKLRLASEVDQVRITAEREVGVLQAKLRREQMNVSSLVSSLDDKRRENEELTKICDELIAGVERKS